MSYVQFVVGWDAILKATVHSGEFDCETADKSYVQFYAFGLDAILKVTVHLGESDSETAEKSPF